MATGTADTTTRRPWVWAPLVIGWLPMWGLFTLLFVSAHGGGLLAAAWRTLQLVVSAALLGLLVTRGVARLPWPHPMRLRFVLLHALAATAYAFAWIALGSLIESLWRRQFVIVLGVGLGAFVITGIWFYVMIAGVAYANRAAQRSAEIEAQEARQRLAALRAQLQPHFLFNALHTVIQLIAIDPGAAVHAAEQLAGLLRTTMDEPADHVRLADEWALVQRYLAIEQLRLGERLVVQAQLAPDALACELPSFTLQTLVENAVRHGAAPREAATTITIGAHLERGDLVLAVADDGAGADLSAPSAGTGLRRLRERLGGLYGASASLRLDSAPGRGFSAHLQLPRRQAG